MRYKNYYLLVFKTKIVNYETIKYTKTDDHV